MSEYNSDRAKERLLKRIRHDKRNIRKNRARRILQYAGIGLVILALGYVYNRTNIPNKNVEGIEDYKNAVTLQLSDGRVMAISEEGNAPIFDKEGRQVGIQKGARLIYDKAATAKATAYNTVKVPYGKRFRLILADGTGIHLNSGSKLKFPVRFTEGRKREVFLEGEGYFEVAKDKKHPFVVYTDDLNIRVLGTQFNVSAYPEDEDINTVLIEGSVGFFEEGGTFDATKNPILEPGHIASWQKQRNSLRMEQTDPALYTGWMDGKVIFDHTKFRDIRKKLERSYNVSISNRYEELKEIRFTASFDTETIDQVLSAFSKNYPIRYSRDGNKIYIEKP